MNTQITELTDSDLSLVTGGGDTYELGDTMEDEDGNVFVCDIDDSSPSGMAWHQFSL
ncbi:MAG: hypothetical protein U0235_00885 [Polyangiaceae bacterium]